jgi:hypothetical protein
LTLNPEEHDVVSKVDIVNIALDDMLGVDPIATLDDNSSAARKAKRRIDDVIRSVLSMSDWSFARTVLPLAQLATNDWTERYSIRYSLPNDMVKAIRLVPLVELPNTSPIPYSILGTSLYTDEANAKLLYTREVTDVGAWPMPFVETVAAYLARTLAMPLTRKRQLFVDMNTVFQAQLAQAVESDAAQEVTFWGHPSSYLEARGARTSSAYDGTGADGSSYWS